MTRTTSNLNTELINSTLSRVVNTRDRIIFRLFLQTGCTPQELINIKNSDIDFSKNTLKTIKRTASLPAALSQEIKQFVNTENKYLFSTQKSPKITTRTIHRLFEKYSSKLGVKITTHDLRKLWIKESLSQNQTINTGNKRFDTKKYITKEEVLKIKRRLSRRDKLILDMLFECGCQVNEVVEIKTKDINFFKKILRIKQREISLSEKLVTEIRKFSEHNPAEDKLFSTRQGRGITEKRIFQIIKQNAAATGMKISPKILRYSYLVHSIESGKPLDEIKQESGIRNLDKFHLYGVFYHE